MERMDAMISETDDDGLPVAYNRVAGVVVTGNEDGAHHVIAEVAQAPDRHRLHRSRAGVDLLEQGPRPRPELPGEHEKHEWSETTGRTAAANLVARRRGAPGAPHPAR